MANKSDFTPEEWTKVLESIMVAVIAGCRSKRFVGNG